jgi:uncharacterized membrane protein YraQ (UPF0718 family)
MRWPWASFVVLAPIVQSGSECCHNHHDDEGDHGDLESTVSTLQRFLVSWANEMSDNSPWLLLGILIVGVLTPLQPSKIQINRVLTIGQFSPLLASFFGAALGLVIPVCSCGAIPLASGIAASGSVSAAIAFAFVAQSSGLDSLFYTAGAFGYKVALARVGCAMLFGCVISVLVAGTHPDNARPNNDPCCSYRSISGNCKSAPKRNLAGFVSMATDAMLQVFGEVAPWIVAGVTVTSVLKLLQPGKFGFGSPSSMELEEIDGSFWYSDVLRRAAFLGWTLPVQICEHAVVNFVIALSTYISPGTAFAFLVLAPATNFGFFMFILKHVSRWAAALAAVVCVVCGVTMSLLVDQLPGFFILNSKGIHVKPKEEYLPDWFLVLARPLLCLLAAAALYRRLQQSAFNISVSPFFGGVFLYFIIILVALVYPEYLEMFQARSL